MASWFALLLLLLHAAMRGVSQSALRLMQQDSWLDWIRNSCFDSYDNRISLVSGGRTIVDGMEKREDVYVYVFRGGLALTAISTRPSLAAMCKDVFPLSEKSGLWMWAG